MHRETFPGCRLGRKTARECRGHLETVLLWRKGLSMMQGISQGRRNRQDRIRETVSRLYSRMQPRRLKEPHRKYFRMKFWN